MHIHTCTICVSMSSVLTIYNLKDVSNVSSNLPLLIICGYTIIRYKILTSTQRRSTCVIKSQKFIRSSPHRLNGFQSIYIIMYIVLLWFKYFLCSFSVYLLEKFELSERILNSSIYTHTKYTEKHNNTYFTLSAILRYILYYT